MKLPNAELAVVDIAKLRDYCLNPTHPEGKHKARVFRSALGFTADNAEQLRQVVLDAISATEATPRIATPYGQKFVVDFEVMGLHKPIMMRSAWIIRNDEGFPRLTTCYIL